MQIEMVTKNYVVNEKLRDVIEKKVSKLDKYFDDDTKCKIYLKKEGLSSKMELSLDYKGNFIRAQAYGDNFYNTIDEVLPKIEGQLRKHRTKLEKKLKKNAFVETAPLFDIPDVPDIRIAKVKSFRLDPMTIDEAITEFELMGHTFFVFLDSETGKVKVLYLRDDKNLGLLDLEY